MTANSARIQCEGLFMKLAIGDRAGNHSIVSPTRASLSVVLPMFNEAANVVALVRALAGWLSEEGARRRVDFVFVDDGSTDATRAELDRHLGDLPAQVVAHAKNQGLTAALRTGSEAAPGQLIGWLDSDLTYAPALLSALAQACDDGADVAASSCYHPQGGVDGVAGWRLLVSKSASLAHRLASGARLHTFTSMVRVYRREVLMACWPQRGGFVGVTEVLLRALTRGARVVEVPAVLRRRRAGTSKMRLLRVTRGHLGLLAANALGRLR